MAKKPKLDTLALRNLRAHLKSLEERSAQLRDVVCNHVRVANEMLVEITENKLKSDDLKTAIVQLESPRRAVRDGCADLRNLSVVERL